MFLSLTLLDGAVDNDEPDRSKKIINLVGEVSEKEKQILMETEMRMEMEDAIAYVDIT